MVAVGLHSLIYERKPYNPGPTEDAVDENRRLGIFLKKRRQDLGLTQMQVAQALGYLGPQCVDLWEQGLSTPPEGNLKDIIDLYQITLGEFVDWILEKRDMNSEEVVNVRKKSCERRIEEVQNIEEKSCFVFLGQEFEII